MLVLMDDCNQFGTIAESRTHTKLTEIGFILLTSRNERLPWDRVITHYNNPKKFLRVQIKGTRSESSTQDRYNLWASKGKGGKKELYTKEETDFIVAHIESITGEIHWYIIPVTAVKSTRIRLYPNIKKSKGPYEKYKDAWHLLERKFKKKI